MSITRRRGRQQAIIGGLSILSCSVPSQVSQGGYILPEAYIENREGGVVSLTLEWSFQGIPLSSATVAIPDGTTRVNGSAVTFDVLRNNFGVGSTVSASVTTDWGHSAQCGSIEIVESGGPGGEPAVQTCGVSPSNVNQGGTVTLEATVGNPGDQKRTVSIIWADPYVDTQIASHVVDVAANQTQSATTTVPYDAVHTSLGVGTHTIGARAGGFQSQFTTCDTLTVQAPNGGNGGNGGGFPGDGDGLLAGLGYEHAALGAGALVLGYAAYERFAGNGAGPTRSTRSTRSR